MCIPEVASPSSAGASAFLTKRIKESPENAKILPQPSARNHGCLGDLKTRCKKEGTRMFPPVLFKEKSPEIPMSSPARPIRRVDESAITTPKETNENKDNFSLCNTHPGERYLPERQ